MDTGRRTRGTADGMRVKTVQINWHDGQPIFSVDFDHNYEGSEGGWRFATGGGDNNVRIWRLRSVREREDDGTAVEFVAGLNRHTAPVNVVRFSPSDSRLASAGDDGAVIVWRQAETGRTVTLDDPEATATETWRPAAVLRGSLADISDLAWSPDGAFLASASVDNTVRIWHVREARCIQVLADHTHYVQGIAWDPLGRFLATQSSDRSMRVYRWAATHTLRPGDGPATLAATHVTMTSDESHRQRLFHDDNLASFFRRPDVSPDGRLLAAAAGLLRTAPGSRNACLLWARDRLTAAPVMALPGLRRPAVAVRWAPCEFAAPDRAGWATDARRMMLAVASQSAVAIYDTSCPARAVAMFDGLHYAALTDLAWTRDGSQLLVVSIDGFATLASLDQPTESLPLPRRSEPTSCASPVRPSPTLSAAPPVSAGRKRMAPTFVGSL
ncbi:Chromatin assembly factor 1 subunit [Coemansia sp. RSA 988]|nr:Chromatin assembly factor 1 subunit [Coemansia sp. RSA 988]